MITIFYVFFSSNVDDVGCKDKKSDVFGISEAKKL